MYEEIEIVTCTEYFEYINKLDTQHKFLYRGQERDWPLEAKIFRLPLKNEFIFSEKYIISEFKKRVQSPKYKEKIQLNSFCELDILSMANHYGLPTRLLDWTESSTYALWFCVKKIQEIFDEYGIIWVLQYHESDVISNLMNYNPYENIEVLKIFNPENYNTDRITAQKGIFTLPIYSKDKQQFIPLNAYTFSKSLIKIKIPSSSFCDIREELTSRSIDEEILFPDIEGLCRCIEMKNIMNEQELKNHTLRRQ